MSTRPDAAIAEAFGSLRGTPVFVAGSCVAAEAHGFDSFSDLDLFCPTQQVLISTIQHLLDDGYTMDDRFSRVWHRWLRYGLKGFHTNSMRMYSKADVETNVVFKIVDGHPTTTLAQVLESFDFGLLGVGYDFEQDTRRDIRPYLFPGMDIDGPLPLMPGRRDAWRNGFVSQYNGLREAARYAKYWRYGYDMSAIKDDLVTGYRMVASYHLSKSDDEDAQLLGQIYTTLGDRIEDDEVDELAESYKSLDFKDALDEILEALE
jgi:hypothetical protein